MNCRLWLHLKADVVSASRKRLRKWKCFLVYDLNFGRIGLLCGLKLVSAVNKQKGAVKGDDQQAVGTVETG